VDTAVAHGSTAPFTDADVDTNAVADADSVAGPDPDTAEAEGFKKSKVLLILRRP
jgi:hypothetical protein